MSVDRRGSCSQERGVSGLAAGPPAVAVTTITDPTTINADIELIDQDAVGLERLPLRARRVVVGLDGATIVLSSTNRRLRTSTRVHDGLLAYVTFGPHANGTMNGMSIRPGLLLAAAPQTEARFVVEAGWESITILVPPGDVRAHLVARGRERDFRVPSGIEALQADPDGVRRLFDWGKRLTTMAARQPEIFNDGKKERTAAHIELLEELLRVLRVAEPLEITRADQTHQTRSDIVRRAEEHVLSRVDETVSVTDLCRAIGVSERSLEYAFRDVMSLTPVGYLIRLRLHRVRQRLLAETHASTTVSREALDWGFWHFGDFSRAYKQCFGELPSETLERPPEKVAMTRGRQ